MSNKSPFFTALFSLRSLLVLPFALVVTVAVALAGYLALNHGQTALNTNALQLRDAISVRIKQDLQQYLRMPFLINHSFVNMVQDNVLQLDDSQEIEAYLRKQLTLFDSAISIQFGGANKYFIGVERHPNGTFTINNTGENQDIYTTTLDIQGNRFTTPAPLLHAYDPTQWAWYQDASQPDRLSSWQVQIGQSAWRARINSTDPLRLTLTYSTPVYRENTLLGVVATDMDLQYLQGTLQALPDEQIQHSFIVERKGGLIATVGKESLFHIDRQQRLVRIDASEAEHALTLQLSQYLLRHFGNLDNIDQMQYLERRVGGKIRLLHVVPLHENGLDWLLVLLTAKPSLIQTMPLQQILAVGLAALVLIIILGVLLAEWILKPIHMLKQTVERLTAGKWQTKGLPLRRDDELGQLARHVDEMAMKLHARATEWQERNRRDQHLRQEAETANKAKTKFLADMSHELRTPLNAIIGYSEMLKDDAAETCDHLLEDLTRVESAGRQLLSVVSDVMDISKVETGRVTLHPVEFTVGNLIKEVSFTIKPELRRGVELSFDCPPEIGMLKADAARIRQILLNLLSNAAKFTRQGQIRLEVKRDNIQMHFAVIDTGSGIPKHKLEEIFKAFSQVDSADGATQSGSGLGLTICDHLSRMMGGRIQVESEVGKGSTFTFSLPLHPPAG